MGNDLKSAKYHRTSQNSTATLQSHPQHAAHHCRVLAVAHARRFCGLCSPQDSQTRLRTQIVFLRHVGHGLQNPRQERFFFFVGGLPNTVRPIPSMRFQLRGIAPIQREPIDYLEALEFHFLRFLRARLENPSPGWMKKHLGRSPTQRTSDTSLRYALAFVEQGQLLFGISHCVHRLAPFFFLR